MHFPYYSFTSQLCSGSIYISGHIFELHKSRHDTCICSLPGIYDPTCKYRNESSSTALLRCKLNCGFTAGTSRSGVWNTDNHIFNLVSSLNNITIFSGRTSEFSLSLEIEMRFITFKFYIDIIKLNVCLKATSFLKTHLILVTVSLNIEFICLFRTLK